MLLKAIGPTIWPLIQNISMYHLTHKRHRYVRVTIKTSSSKHRSLSRHRIWFYNTNRVYYTLLFPFPVYFISYFFRCSRHLYINFICYLLLLFRFVLNKFYLFHTGEYVKVFVQIIFFFNIIALRLFCSLLDECVCMNVCARTNVLKSCSVQM